MLHRVLRWCAVRRTEPGLLSAGAGLGALRVAGSTRRLVLRRPVRRARVLRARLRVRRAGRHVLGAGLVRGRLLMFDRSLSGVTLARPGRSRVGPGATGPGRRVLAGCRLVTRLAGPTVRTARRLSPRRLRRGVLAAGVRAAGVRSPRLLGCRVLSGAVRSARLLGTCLLGTGVLTARMRADLLLSAGVPRSGVS